MALHDRVSNLINGIYASILDPPLWTEAVKGLIDITGSRWALAAVLDTTQSVFPQADFIGLDSSSAADGINDYLSGRTPEDPSVAFSVSHPHARIFRTERFFADRHAHDPWIRWNARHFGSEHWALHYTPPKGELVFGIALHQPPNAGPMDEKFQGLFGNLFGHFENALRIDTALRRFQAGTPAETPTIYLDFRGHVMFANGPAEDILRLGDALSFDGGTLRVTRRIDQGKLDGMIARALQARSTGYIGGAMQLKRKDRVGSYKARVVPLVRADFLLEWFRPAAAVYLTSIDPTGMPPAQYWQQLYGFSDAELRLLEAWWSQDFDLRRAADLAGIAYATARVHLRSIFRKAEVNTQERLVRRLII
jgi:DNA-binding CsgD family transcriptional regulator